MSEEQIKHIVDRAISAHRESVRKRNQWIIALVFSGILAILGSCIAGIVVVIQNDVKLSSHTEDGHPETVKKMIKAQETLSHAQSVQLTRIEVNQLHLMKSVDDQKSSIDEIKKKLSNGI